MKRNQKLDRIIRLAWASLETHLLDEDDLPKKKCCRSIVGEEKFHRDVIKDYATIIKLAAELYD